MTHKDLWQILTQAEARACVLNDAKARADSAETVALCYERMYREGLTRAKLSKLAKGERT
jgi:hypothetical protein